MKLLSSVLLLSLSLFLFSCGEKEEVPAAETPQPAADAPAEPALSAETAALIAAAESGDPAAQNNLALLYAVGEGVEADAAKAVELYRAAAEQGLAEARFNLARCYALGTGVEVNEAAFIEHCTKAAYAGLAAAQYTLGCAYRDGLGVAPDAAEAERWLSRAEMNGYEPAKAAWKALREQKK